MWLKFTSDSTKNCEYLGTRKSWYYSRHIQVNGTMDRTFPKNPTIYQQSRFHTLGGSAAEGARENSMYFIFS